MMYDTVDTVYDCIRIATGVLSTLKIRPERMLKGGWAGGPAVIEPQSAALFAHVCLHVADSCFGRMSIIVHINAHDAGAHHLSCRAVC
jgi:hypothetical protein